MGGYTSYGEHSWGGSRVNGYYGVCLFFYLSIYFCVFSVRFGVGAYITCHFLKEVYGVPFSRWCLVKTAGIVTFEVSSEFSPFLARGSVGAFSTGSSKRSVSAPCRLFGLVVVSTGLSLSGIDSF